MDQPILTPNTRIQSDSIASDDDDFITTDFESIASTIPNFVYENGRRYHARYANRYVSLPTPT